MSNSAPQNCIAIVFVFADLQTFFSLHMNRNAFDLFFGLIVPDYLKTFINQRKVSFDFKLSHFSNCSDDGESPKRKQTTKVNLFAKLLFHIQKHLAIYQQRFIFRDIVKIISEPKININYYSSHVLASGN